MLLKSLVKYHPTGLVARAYQLAEKAHAGQKRKSGEPYFSHARAVGEILAEWNLDEATIAAGLLHDTVEDTAVTTENVRKEFGGEVAFIVEGVTKLGRMKYRGQVAKVENFRKLMIALGEDLRVIFVKLADRLHNMRTLDALPREKQKRVAVETDEIYAPIAYRLGMHNVSGELQDLAFPYIHPDEYEWLRSKAMPAYEERLRYLKKLLPELEKLLQEESLKPVEIDFRAKRYASLYHKLVRHHMDIEKIYDLVAVRIIVKTTGDCYAALGALHATWPPLPGRIKDYIAMPKPNGYRSLHTTVFGPDDTLVEIQIRTKEMHEEAENGIAAHWLYHERKRLKNGRDKNGAKNHDLAWVGELRHWHEKREAGENPETTIETMKIDFFKNRIFAVTPSGEVVDLPSESTPVDFAYHIHSELGNTCVGAKVNGEFVGLDHKLRSGDMVHIMTQKNKKPSEDWLKFAKTSMARDHIRAALRKKERSSPLMRRPVRAELKLVVKDRVGLMKDITSIIARSHFNIVNFSMIAPPGNQFHVDKIELETGDREKVGRLILKLKKLKEVREISFKMI